ncbi:unnamed protein product [Soboliphyme baturini]|uniref:Vps5 domain-containing protein n=1 Tax=Soboliphyme baturini TaxID=241478 RepID=A0A183IZ02_9BILA|nr:unnamed protein product [Soboliphyme baturini]
MAVAYYLALLTFFQKKENHLLCRQKKSQIDYFLLLRNELKNLRDCKTSLGTAHSNGGRDDRPVDATVELEGKLKAFKMEVTRKTTKYDWNKEVDDVWERMAT